MPRRSPERRLRAAAVLARDDAGAAGSPGAAAPRCRGRGRRRRRLHGRHRGAGARPPRRERHPVEAETLGFGGSTRNGGIVHPGYKWGPRTLVKRYGDETGRDLFRDTLDAYGLVKRLIADESIDCEFRECGYLDLAYGASHVGDLIESGRTLVDFGVDAAFVPREQLREEIGSDAYHGGLAVAQGALLHPGKYFAGLAAAAERAGADLHEGVRARGVRRQADGRVRRRDRPRRDPREGRRRRHERLHGRLRPVAPPPDHPDRRATSSRPSHSPRSWHASSRRRAGRSSTRRTSSTTGTSRPTGGWCSAAGRASCRRRSTGPRGSSTRACSRSIRSSPATASTTRGAATSASRSTGCRTSGGWTA